MKEDVIFNESIFHYIITKYTGNEEGMRNTKRIFEELLLQINLIKLLNDDINKQKYKNIHKNLTINYNIIELKFPLLLNEKIIDDLLKNYN
jgi:hypothetical protein